MPDSEMIAQVARLEVKVETLEKTCTELTKSVNDLTAVLNQTKGGWFVISTVAAAAMAVGSLITQFLQK